MKTEYLKKLRDNITLPYLTVPTAYHSMLIAVPHRLAFTLLYYVPMALCS